MQGNNEFARTYINAIVKDRQALYVADMWRTLGLLLAGVGIIYLYIKQIIKPAVLFALLILLTTIDLVGVGKRYLTDESFVEPADYETAYADYNADTQIKRDPGYFRVMNMAFRNPGNGTFQGSIGNAFNDAIASYKHNTIGGYHPAKLSIYEDLKGRMIYKNLEAWAANPNAKDSFKILNMLNMKYVIVPDQTNPKQTTAILNPYAYGNCWLIKDIQYVKTADEEMSALDKITPLTTAVINEKFKKTIPFTTLYDSASYIKLLENNNDEIRYEFNSSNNQFAVFSEMYYSKGWDAYIDGKLTDYAKVDYALRGLAIPAGKHTIEFKFESKLLNLGEKIANYAAIFSLLFIVISLFMIWKNNRNSNDN
ncbi:MAG: YfhO family protein [Sphingobacteriales bacterium]|nr:YfhO family protein [Sphingobacteriales bacterium]